MEAPIYQSENIAVRPVKTRSRGIVYGLYRPYDKTASIIDDAPTAAEAIRMARIVDEHGGSLACEVRKLWRTK